jgi:thiol:disulfide interchange protein DsbA
MRLRLPLLCTALIALAACGSGNNDTAATTPTPPPAATAAAPAATAPAPASTAATASPAAVGTAAAVAAPVAAPATDADDANRPAPKPFVDDGKWVEGKNYFRIDPAQPTSSPGKIEVTEVFSYGCPFCYQFNGLVDQLAKDLPRGAVMTYTPASFRPDENWPLLQRAFLTAQALGVEKQGHDAMFDAVNKGSLSIMDSSGDRRKPQSAWPTIDDVAKVYAKYGVKAEDFVATANSFTINTKMKRADELVRAYEVDGTPAIIVNGKYRLSPASAGGYPQAVELTQWLVSKEAAGK